MKDTPDATDVVLHSSGTLSLLSGFLYETAYGYEFYFLTFFFLVPPSEISPRSTRKRADQEWFMVDGFRHRRIRLLAEMVNGFRLKTLNPQSTDVATILHRRTSAALFSFYLHLVQHVPRGRLPRLATGTGRLV